MHASCPIVGSADPRHLSRQDLVPDHVRRSGRGDGFRPTVFAHAEALEVEPTPAAEDHPDSDLLQRSLVGALPMTMAMTATDGERPVPVSRVLCASKSSLIPSVAWTLRGI